MFVISLLNWVCGAAFGRGRAGGDGLLANTVVQCIICTVSRGQINYGRCDSWENPFPSGCNNFDCATEELRGADHRR